MGDGLRRNFMHCEVTLPISQLGKSCRQNENLVDNPSVECDSCPCNPKFDLQQHGRYPFVHTSPYVVDVCKVVLQSYACDFHHAALVGFGIAILSSCLSEACPSMRLTTIDIDADVVEVGRRFFGWRNQSAVVSQMPRSSSNRSVQNLIWSLLIALGGMACSSLPIFRVL